MTRIKALLLGLGQIGCGYDLDQPFQPDQACSGAVTWTHARALACHAQVELVAAVDPSAQARERFSAVYSCPAFADLEEYFQGPGHMSLIWWWWLCRRPFSRRWWTNCWRDAALACCCWRSLSRSTLKRLSACVRLATATPIWCGGELHPALFTRGLELQSQLKAGPRRAAARSPGVRQGLLSNGSHFVNLAEAWLGPLRSGAVLSKALALPVLIRGLARAHCVQHNDAVLHVQALVGLGCGPVNWISGSARAVCSGPTTARSVQWWRLVTLRG